MENSAPVSSYNDGTILYNHIKYENVSKKLFGAQTHDVWEMIFLKEGDLNYTVEGNIYHVKSNSLILTRPGSAHVLQLNDTKVYDRYDILFDNSILTKNIQKQIPPDLHVITFEKPEMILFLFEKLDYYYKYFDGEIMGNILRFCIEEVLYNSLISSHIFDFEKEDIYKKNDILIKAIEYINANISTNFTLDTLCQEIFITKGYLYKIFKQFLDISPKKYIISKRLAKAQLAMKDKKKPTEIFFECGFTEYSTFYRNFVKFYGYPPSDESNTQKIIEINS